MNGAVLLDKRTPPPISVIVATVRTKQVEGDHMDCLIDLIMTEPLIGGRVSRRSGPNISAARNGTVEDFLRGPGTHLLMLDADMTFEPDLVRRLLSHRKHIVGGLCNALVAGEPVPVLKRMEAPTGMPGEMVNVEPTGGLMKVTATGAACLLVHRIVFEMIPEPKVGFRWFAEQFTEEGQYLSEDITFCVRAAEAGFQTWVDTDYKVGHIKERII